MANDYFLWNKLKQGDKRSFELVFKMYYPQLCLFANKYCDDFEAAKEVVQDLFIYMWENREKLEDMKSVKAYFFAAVRFNSIRRNEEKKRKRVDILEVPEDMLKIDFSDEIAYTELQEKIFQSIEQLPPRCKKIFEMSRFDQMSYRRIASTLGISPRTVEAQISKALKHIQKAYDEYKAF